MKTAMAVATATPMTRGERRPRTRETSRNRRSVPSQYALLGPTGMCIGVTPAAKSLVYGSCRAGMDRRTRRAGEPRRAPGRCGRYRAGPGTLITRPFIAHRSTTRDAGFFLPPFFALPGAPEATGGGDSGGRSPSSRTHRPVRPAGATASRTSKRPWSSRARRRPCSIGAIWSSPPDLCVSAVTRGDADQRTTCHAFATNVAMPGVRRAVTEAVIEVVSATGIFVARRYGRLRTGSERARPIAQRHKSAPTSGGKRPPAFERVLFAADRRSADARTSLFTVMGCCAASEARHRPRRDPREMRQGRSRRRNRRANLEGVPAADIALRIWLLARAKPGSPALGTWDFREACRTSRSTCSRVAVVDRRMGVLPLRQNGGSSASHRPSDERGQHTPPRFGRAIGPWTKGIGHCLS